MGVCRECRLVSVVSQYALDGVAGVSDAVSSSFLGRGRSMGRAATTASPRTVNRTYCAPRGATQRDIKPWWTRRPVRFWREFFSARLTRLPGRAADRVPGAGPASGRPGGDARRCNSLSQTVVYLRATRRCGRWLGTGWAQLPKNARIGLIAAMRIDRLGARCCSARELLNGACNLLGCHLMGLEPIATFGANTRMPH